MNLSAVFPEIVVYSFEVWKSQKYGPKSETYCVCHKVLQKIHFAPSIEHMYTGNGFIYCKSLTDCSTSIIHALQYM